MGLLDKATGTDGPMSAAEGVAGVLVYAVTADGVITNEEFEGLRALLGRMQLYKDPKLLDLGLDRANRTLKYKGPEALLRAAAAAVPAELRATAFALCTDLVLADGEVHEAEERCLERVQQALGVPDAQADEIVRVMVLKNQG